MRHSPTRWGRLALAVLLALAAIGGGVALVFAFLARPAAASPQAGDAPAAPRCRLIDADTLDVPYAVQRALGVRTAEAYPPTRPRLLHLTGALALDSDRLARVHPRFAGEVVALGTASGKETTDLGGADRPLRVGDKVRPLQLLAVIYSKDLGEKKSELIDALSRLRLDQDALERARALDKSGNAPERALREAERGVEADLIAVARAERALVSWRLTEAELKEAYDEAAKLVRLPAKNELPARDRAADRRWARVEVRAPLGGTVLEKNFTLGDLVDTPLDLVKIGDTSALALWAQLHEEDLPALREVKLPLKVAVRAVGRDVLFEGELSRVGDLIDPVTRTALLSGHVANPGGEMRANQAVSVTLQLPAAAGEVEVPAAAVVEDGSEAVVFVQPDAARPWFVARKVAVARRFRDVCCLRGEPPHGLQTVKPGERVVAAGALLLRSAQQDLATD